MGCACGQIAGSSNSRIPEVERKTATHNCARPAAVAASSLSCFSIVTPITLSNVQHRSAAWCM